MADDQCSIISSGGSTDTLNKLNSSSSNLTSNSRERSSRNNHRLFPVSTYTELPNNVGNIRGSFRNGNSGGSTSSLTSSGSPTSPQNQQQNELNGNSK